MSLSKQWLLSITVTDIIQRFPKTAVIGLKSYVLFGTWTTVVEKTDRCLWSSLFKYVQYVDHYQIVCLSPHWKPNYFVLTSENWVICKDTLIQSQVHVTPLHGKVYPYSFPSTALQPLNCHSLLSVPFYTIVSPDWGDLKISIQGAACLKE